jgi:uncharacterized protein with NRDE domain
MCLILLAYRQHADHPLLIAANRDEYHRRPAEAARFWPQAPQLLAGRDLLGGGTWLGVTRNGRFAAVTNFREPGATSGERSRGELCTNFLLGNSKASQFASDLAPGSSRYGGYNLLLWDGEELCYCSNQNRPYQVLQPGIYGVSNGYLDEAWPKVVTGKDALTRALAGDNVLETCLAILNCRQQPGDHHLPDTGVGLEFERLLAPRFILSHEYGTRVSTVLSVPVAGDLSFIEKSFDASGACSGRVRYDFPVKRELAEGKK